MKANKSIAITVVGFSIFASNAFAVLRPPCPIKPDFPDRVVIIGNEKEQFGSTRDDYSRIEMNPLFADQAEGWIIRVTDKSSTRAVANRQAATVMFRHESK